jgi:hypothetical protein
MRGRSGREGDRTELADVYVLFAPQTKPYARVFGRSGRLTLGARRGILIGALSACGRGRSSYSILNEGLMN